jgi:hypothetical protein
LFNNFTTSARDTALTILTPARQLAIHRTRVFVAYHKPLQLGGACDASMCSCLQDCANLFLVATSARFTTFALFGPSRDDAVDRTWLYLALTHFVRRAFGRLATKLCLNSKRPNSGLPSWSTTFITHAPGIPFSPFSVHRAISEFATLLLFEWAFALEATILGINKDIPGSGLSTVTAGSIAWRPS